MPAAQTLAGAPAHAHNDQQALPLVPFVRAADEHQEQFMDISQQIGAGTVVLPPTDVPAYGFMRGIWLLIEATGGAGTPTFLADAPFSAIQDVSLADVNGAPLYGPFAGYEVYAITRHGGYRRAFNPKASPDFNGGDATGNFSYLVYIPVEVNLRDGLGALANLNAASSYKLRVSIAAASAIYGTNPTTFPTVRVRAWLDAWTQPTPTDLEGNPQATQPPAHGTTQYWSKQIVNINGGVQTVRQNRVGNLLRENIYIFRDGTGARNATNWPPAFDLYWDSRLLKDYNTKMWRQQMCARLGLAAPATDDAVLGLDKGVFVEDYAHEFDGGYGAELRDGWLPTAQSTRLESIATWGAAGTLTIITNDVSPAGDVFV